MRHSHLPLKMGNELMECGSKTGSKLMQRTKLKEQQYDEGYCMMLPLPVGNDSSLLAFKASFLSSLVIENTIYFNILALD